MRLGPASAALLACQPIRQAPGFFVRLLRLGAVFLRAAGAWRLGGFAREPQCLQPRHVVEHGLCRGVAFGLAGLASWRRGCLVEARIGAVAIFFCHLGRFLFSWFSFLAFGSGRLVAVGGFLRQSQCAQIRRPFSNRDVGRRDIGHRLDAFGILGELSVQPDLFQFGGAFGSSFIMVPQNSRRTVARRGTSLTTICSRTLFSAGKDPFSVPKSAMVMKGRSAKPARNRLFRSQNVAPAFTM